MVTAMAGNGTQETSSHADQLMVTRKLFRSGESEYFINKVGCRLKDIVELFLDSGVGSKSYSIMEQGKVDYILSLKPDERRILVEEAAGIAKYRSRKKEALNRMKSTKNNLYRLNDLLNEIKIQMHALGLQVKRLKRHRTLTEEIRNIDLLLASVRLKDLNTSSQELKKQLTKYRDEEINLTAKKNSTEAALEKNRLLLQELHKKIEQLQEEYYIHKESIQSEENTIQINERELQNTHALIEKSNQTIIELSENLQIINSDISSKKTALETVSQKILSLENDFNTSSAALLESKKILGETQGKIEIEKNDLMQITLNRTEINNSIKLNTRLHEETAQRLSKIEEDRKACFAGLSELKESIILQNNKINELTEQQEQKNIAIHSETGRQNTLKSTLTENTSVFNDLKDEISNKKAYLNSLTELQNNLEGFDEGVRALMQASKDNQGEISGIAGLLADFIVTDSKYETALEAALGRKLQAIIFNTTEDGLTAIAHLKNRQNGKISCLTPSTVNQSLNIPEIANCTPLLNFVKTNGNYDQIINALLSDVFLVENINTAIDIWEKTSKKYTFITPEGDLIDEKGTFTGGAAVNTGTGILKRNREIREYTEAVKKLESKFITVNEKKISLETELHTSTQLLEQLIKEKNELNIMFIQEKTAFEQMNREKSLAEEKLDQLSCESEENVKLQEAHQSGIKKLEIDNDQIEKEEQNKQQYLAKLKESEIVQKETLLNLETDHTELRVLLASIKQKKENLITDINRLTHELNTSRSKIDNLRNEKSNLESNTGSITTRIEGSKNQLQSKIGKSQELDKLIEEERKRAHLIEESVKSDEEQLKKLRTRWDEIEPRIRDNELRLNESSIHIEHLQNDLSEKYAMNFDALPPAPEDNSFNADESRERLEKLKKRLENIGDVNLGAAKEFEELEKRYTFLTEQADDLHQSIDSLQNVITRINKITRQKFSETFNKINNHFKELFPLLFNGGKAYMQLTDEANILETGIDIFAQPPGKKLQSLDLLSGGERALTVISVMFAIFLTKPSPFCLMDEIDAPLDDSSIGRFISHMHKMAERSQFLIVTHNKLSMQAANSLYGVTMEEKGVSKIVSVDLN